VSSRPLRLVGPHGISKPPNHPSPILADKSAAHWRSSASGQNSPSRYVGRLDVVVCSNSAAARTTTSTHLADTFVVCLHRQHTHNRFKYKITKAEYPSVEAARAVSHARSMLARIASSHAMQTAAQPWLGQLGNTPRQQLRDRKDY